MMTQWFLESGKIYVSDILWIRGYNGFYNLNWEDDTYILSGRRSSRRDLQSFPKLSYYRLDDNKGPSESVTSHEHKDTMTYET